MLGTFLDKSTTIFSRQFLVAYWFPSFLFFCIAGLIKVYVYGWGNALVWWGKDSMVKGLEGGFYAQIWIIVGSLIIITLFAYLLQPFTRTIVRFYEGYWSPILQRWFTNLSWFGEKNIKKRIEGKKNKKKGIDPQAKLFYSYPREESRIMPTGLGNALRAAEDYSWNVYGMDCVFWWQRLWFLLPDRVRGEVNDSLVPIVALLNFTTLTVIESVLGPIYLKEEGFGWKIYLLLFICLVFLALLSYWAAVKQAMVYGNKIRAAIDLYRFDLFKAMHQELPNTLDEETYLWNQLMRWAYTYDRGTVATMRYKHN